MGEGGLGGAEASVDIVAFPGDDELGSGLEGLIQAPGVKLGGAEVFLSLGNVGGKLGGIEGGDNLPGGDAVAAVGGDRGQVTRNLGVEGGLLVGADGARQRDVACDGTALDSGGGDLGGGLRGE